MARRHRWIVAACASALVLAWVFASGARRTDALPSAAEAEARAINEVASTLRQVNERTRSLRTHIDEVLRNLDRRGAEARGDVPGWERELAELRSEAERVRALKDRLQTANLETARDQPQGPADRREVDRALRTFRELDRRLRELATALGLTERRLRDLQARMGRTAPPPPEPSRRAATPSPPEETRPPAVPTVRPQDAGTVEIEIDRRLTSRRSRGGDLQDHLVLRQSQQVALEEDPRKSRWAEDQWGGCVRRFRLREVTTRLTGTYVNEDQVFRNEVRKTTAQIARRYRGADAPGSRPPSIPISLFTSVVAPDPFISEEAKKRLARANLLLYSTVYGDYGLFRGIPFWRRGFERAQIEDLNGVFTIYLNPGEVTFDATVRTERRRPSGALEVTERQREVRFRTLLGPARSVGPDVREGGWSQAAPVASGVSLWPPAVSGVLSGSPELPYANNRIRFEHRLIRASDSLEHADVALIWSIRADLRLEGGESQPPCFVRGVVAQRPTERPAVTETPGTGRPTGDAPQPTAPRERPGTPVGEQPSAPMGEQPGTPVGEQPSTPVGETPPRPPVTTPPTGAPPGEPPSGPPVAGPPTGSPPGEPPTPPQPPVVTTPPRGPIVVGGTTEHGQPPTGPQPGETPPPPPPTERPPTIDEPPRSVEGCTATERVVFLPRTTDWLTPPPVQEAPRSPAVGAYNVFLHDGSIFHSRTDLSVRSVGMDFTFSRIYRSAITTLEGGLLGHGWDFSLNKRIVVLPRAQAARSDGLIEDGLPGAVPGGPADMMYLNGLGRADRFKHQHSEVRQVKNFGSQFRALVSTYAPPPGFFMELQRYENRKVRKALKRWRGGEFRVEFGELDPKTRGTFSRKTNTILINPFDQHGNLRSVEDLAAIFVHEYTHFRRGGELRAWFAEYAFLRDLGPRGQAEKRFHDLERIVAGFVRPRSFFRGLMWEIRFMWGVQSSRGENLLGYLKGEYSPEKIRSPWFSDD